MSSYCPRQRAYTFSIRPANPTYMGITGIGRTIGEARVDARRFLRQGERLGPVVEVVDADDPVQYEDEDPVPFDDE